MTEQSRTKSLCTENTWLVEKRESIRSNTVLSRRLNISVGRAGFARERDACVTARHEGFYREGKPKQRWYREPVRPLSRKGQGTFLRSEYDGYL